jgi:hypothetical protein
VRNAFIRGAINRAGQGGRGADGDFAGKVFLPGERRALHRERLAFHTPPQLRNAFAILGDDV